MRKKLLYLILAKLGHRAWRWWHSRNRAADTREPVRATPNGRRPAS